MAAEQKPKLITGYCEPWSVRGGDDIKLMASSHKPGVATLDMVRIHCGDPTRWGPGFSEEVVESTLPVEVNLVEQPLTPGSYGVVELPEGQVTANSEFAVTLCVMSTRPHVPQTVFSVNFGNRELCLVIEDGALVLDFSERMVMSDLLERGRWYDVSVVVTNKDAENIETRVRARTSRSPGRDAVGVGDTRHGVASIEKFFPCGVTHVTFAGCSRGANFDGRIARPTLNSDSIALSWDFSQQIDSAVVNETGRLGAHGRLLQLPARGVTGPDWDGTVHSWAVDPSHYDAIHFHTDDLYDAEWEVSASCTLPDNLPSGIYAFRLGIGSEIDRIPFFVRPARGAPTAKVALLMPSCTYIAYANHRMLFEGADFVAARQRLRPEHEYIRDHPALGASLYEKHQDGSGVMYSSRRRPILQVRPGADGWNFTPDTDINAFLAHLDVGHDIVTDEDLHHEGWDAIAPYRVLVTGTHPEYWSTQMLDALERWLRAGGRLMYLGGNGFYWRVAFNDDWPGAIELRRAEDGVRNWQTPPGESYHSFNGEYGGLWRRLGRAPNELVGIGFAAQGFEQAVGYQRQADSYDPRAAWIFDRVEEDWIGTSGLGGGAAGQEVDRYNALLGSPQHALVIASATTFGPDMTRTKEELEAAIMVPSPDPVVRADMVFFETPNGGAVFSVGSISWFGALARNGYDNDVATITENVVRRFADPEPFVYKKKPGT